jgi:predicted lactoylglutathione lyase
MSRMLFVNLPVDDLVRSVGFFGSLGFAFNEHFTDDNTACMVVSDQTCVMLLSRPFFATFTTKPVADATVSTQSIVALSAHSRDDVDTLVDTAIAQGGEPAMAPADEGNMYGRSFYDLDGHAWEVIWMEPAGQP